MNYLLVTHIPFTRDEHGQAVVDSLWARDLIGLTKALGPVRVAAPEVDPGKGLTTWGPNSEALPASSNISFRGFPEMKSARSFGAMLKIRAILKQEVAAADIVHTSNFFPPYTCLSYAHDLAVKLGKKTLFVIAEDFPRYARLGMGPPVAGPDLFVMPHRTTDFGRAFWDAMAAGLPVLAFRTAASTDTVYEGRDGFLAPLDDVQGLAERIGHLASNRDLLAVTALGARRRALENTRSEWFRLRADWTRSLLDEGARAA
jgi:hypothetical protein